MKVYKSPILFKGDKRATMLFFVFLLLSLQFSFTISAQEPPIDTNLYLVNPFSPEGEIEAEDVLAVDLFTGSSSYPYPILLPLFIILVLQFSF